MAGALSTLVAGQTTLVNHSDEKAKLLKGVEND